jgi:three-Cys-motif partner protein
LLDSSWYKGREQTYIKHVVLRRYLQKLAYKRGWHGGTINYVDCFAGPWQHATEGLEDTSPFIAIKELREAREELRRRSRPPLGIRCLFIEKHRKSWELLDSKLRAIEDVEIETIHGDFEVHVQIIRQFASGGGARPFTFFFIDPTGWTGYSLDTVTPLLRHQPGEVLINFMTRFITRFVDSDRPEDAGSFNRLFGSAKYRDHWRNLSGLDREDEIVRAYAERVREAGKFSFVASSVVLDPLSDRSQFHLIYATRHIEGLRVFRNDAERPAEKEQQETRWKTQLRREEDRTGQVFLFEQPVGRDYLDKLRERYFWKATDRLTMLLEEKHRVPFDDLEAEALQFPLMSTRVLKGWLEELKKQGKVAYEGLAPGARIPQPGKGHVIVWISPPSG